MSWASDVEEGNIDEEVHHTLLKKVHSQGLNKARSERSLHLNRGVPLRNVQVNPSATVETQVNQEAEIESSEAPSGRQSEQHHLYCDHHFHAAMTWLR